MTEKLNQASLAARFDVSPRRIRTLTTEGWLDRDSDGFYDVAVADEIFSGMDPAQRRIAKEKNEGRSKKPLTLAQKIATLPRYPVPYRNNCLDDLAKIAAHGSLEAGNSMAPISKLIKSMDTKDLESRHWNSTKGEALQDIESISGKPSPKLRYAGDQYNGLDENHAFSFFRRSHLCNLLMLMEANALGLARSLILNRLISNMEAQFVETCWGDDDKIDTKRLARLFEITNDLRGAL